MHTTEAPPPSMTIAPLPASNERFVHLFPLLLFQDQTLTADIKHKNKLKTYINNKMLPCTVSSVLHMATEVKSKSIAGGPINNDSLTEAQEFLKGAIIERTL